MYFVYILKSLKADKYYTGCTEDIKKRLEKHNNGESFWSKKFRPWEIHYVEEINDKNKAFKREKYLKSHAGRNWIKKVLGP